MYLQNTYGNFVTTLLNYTHRFITRQIILEILMPNICPLPAHFLDCHTGVNTNINTKELKKD